MPPSFDKDDFSQAGMAVTPHPDAGVLGHLNAVRIGVVTLIGLGYASTMAVGPGSREWLNVFGYDPSLFGIQVLFFLSGWLAWRSLSRGRTVRQFVASRARRTLPWVVFVTLIVTTLLYPLLCDHDAPHAHGVGELAVYFLNNITLIRPGQPLPGALDGALYPCNLQGTIWTLRWGALAYAGLLALHALRLSGRGVFWVILIALIAGHVGLNAWVDARGSSALEPLIPGMRVAVPFVLGVLARQHRLRLPRDRAGWAVMAAVALGAATLHYRFLPWSYSIELLAMTGWCALAMAALHSRLNALRHWPDIVVPLYLGAWPTAQTWLFLQPDITVPRLVVATLATIFALALAFRLLADHIARPVHRRVQPA
ncbi:MAG: acyltransferase family protein [Pseudomonadota bacterium]